MLAEELTLIQAWTSIQNSIISAGREVYYCVIVNLIFVELLRGDVNQILILLIRDLKSPLADAYLLFHYHKMLIRDLPGILDLARAQGTLIMANIGDLVLEHCEDCCYNSLLCQAATTKEPYDLIGPNNHCLLHLSHVTNVASLPTLWTSLARAPKAQHLTTLQGALDSAADSLVPVFTIVETPALLKCILGFQIHMEDQEDLTTGVYLFTLGKHTIAVQKRLTARAARHALMIGGGAAPSLAEAKT